MSGDTVNIPGSSSCSTAAVRVVGSTLGGRPRPRFTGVITVVVMWVVIGVAMLVARGSVAMDVTIGVCSRDVP